MLNNLKRRALTLLLSLAMIVTYMPVSMITAYAAAGQVPAHNKSRTDNGNGTYKLALDVTGESENDPIANKANVIIVLDLSGSMDWAANLNGRTQANNNTIGRYGYVNNNDYRRLYYRTGTQGNYTYYPEGTGPAATTRHQTVYYKTGFNNDGSPDWDQYNGNRYNYTNNDSRLEQTQVGVNHLIDTLLAQNSGKYSDMVELSLITFSTRAHYVTPGSATANGWVSGTDGSGLKNTVNTSYAVGATNWDEALYYAKALADAKNDGDKTFVVFFSDGEPTQHIGTASSATSHNHSGGASGGGSSSNDADLNAAYYEANRFNGNTADLYGIFAYGTETGQGYMRNLVSYGNYGNASQAKEDVGGFYSSADNQEDIDKAFAAIASSIANAVGISDVLIDDGTTNKVSVGTGTAELLEVDTESFEYWMSWQVSAGTNTFTMFNGGAERTYTVTADESAGTVTITWKEGETNKSATYEGTFIGNVVKIKWDENAPTAFYTKAPKAALDANGHVKWDLDTIDTLLNGVTYTVTFDVFPSQYTYDLIAELKNGTKTYNELPEEIRQYLHSDYSLETNTVATLTYTDTRTDDGPQTKTFDNPPAVATASSALTIEKEWDPIAEAVDLTMTVTKDGEEFYDAELTSENGYSATANISTGLIKAEYAADGTTITSARILDEGHDYTFAEMDDQSYYWDLDAQIVRPMLISSATHISNLVLIEDEEEAAAIAEEMGTKIFLQKDGDTFFKIEGKIYEVSAQADTGHLKATNAKRSNLYLYKNVEGDDPGEASFDFNLTVNAAYNTKSVEVTAGSGGTYTYVNKDGITVTVQRDAAHTNMYVAKYTSEGKTIVLYGNVANGVFTYQEALWFSMWDYNTSAPVKGLTPEGWTEETNSTGTTGYYYAPNGTPLNVAMTKNNNIRFGNIAAGTTYTFVESSMPNNYSYVKAEQTDTTGSVTDGTRTVKGTVTESNKDFSVTYTNRYDKTKITAQKEWVGGQGTSATVEVYKDGQATGNTATLNADNNWKHVFADLDLDGVYTVKETATTPADGWATTYSGSAVVTVSDPSATAAEEVTILSGGEEAGTVTLNEENGYTASVTVTNAYDAEGNFKEITTNPASVTTTITDRNVTVTNTATRDISVTKVWDDDDNRDRLRPESIAVFLYADNEKVDEATLNASNNWSHTWTDKPVKRTDGTTDIVYTVGEENPTYVVKGSLNVDMSGSDEESDTTDEQNIVESETTEVVNEEPAVDESAAIESVAEESATKELAAEADESEGTDADVEESPETVTDEATTSDEPEVKAEEPKKEEVKEVKETKDADSEKANDVEPVRAGEETQVVGYTQTITGDAASGYTITNKYSSKERSITVLKKWEDDNNRDGLRPTSISVQLKANGTNYGDAVTLNESNKWSYTWENLKVNEAGEEIQYTVVETGVPAEYSSETTGSMAEGFTITNTYEPMTTKVTFVKNWDDKNNQDGKRGSVGATVQLYKVVDGVKTPVDEPVAVLTTDNWTHVWTPLPVKDGGKTITYTVEEDLPATSGYTQSYVGASSVTAKETDSGSITIKNSYDPEKVDIGVSKVWDDNNNVAGDRPEKLVVNLLIKGSETVLKTVELTAANNWSASFTDLDKYSNGETITYVVREVLDNATAIAYTAVSGTEVELDTKDADDDNKLSTEFENKRNTGKLTISKTVNSELAADKDAEFTFTITLKNGNKAVSGEFSGVTFNANGEATIKLKGGESKTIEGLPTGTSYAVVETAAADFTTTESGDSGTISETESKAEFTNTRKTGGLKVSKKVNSSTTADKQKGFTFTVTLTGLTDEAANKTYGDMKFENGVATFTLKDGESKEASGLPITVGYTVTEAEAAGFNTSSTGASGSIADPAPTAAFTNARDEGGLTVSKNVVSDVAADHTNKEFTFTVTLSDKTINETYSGVEFKDGVATFTLKDGASKTIQGLPQGITYEVVETDDADFTTTKKGDTGTISDNASTAAFTNTRKTGDLELSKVLVSDLAADADQVFTFTVKLSDTSISKTYGEGDDAVTFENGVATVRLKGGESKTIAGLPTGITYEITEAAVTGIPNTDKTGDKGTITVDGASAEFTNTRETGDLYIYKSVKSDLAADKDVEFIFTLTLEDTTINGTYGDVEFTDGVATITLKDGEDVYATGLPTTLKYKIVEADAAGFTPRYINQEGTVTANSTIEVGAENTRETGSLELSKVLVSDLAADANKEFTFTITLTGLSEDAADKAYSDVQFTNGVATVTLKGGDSKTIEGLPTGVTYAITEADADGFELTGKTGDTGSISTKKSTATFTNTRETGDLEVTKTVVSDNAADANVEFDFTVTLGDTSISDTYGDMTFTEGVATFKLKSGDKKTATGLPTTVTYTVTETANTDFTTEKTGDTGSISTETSTAAFTNTRVQGGLTISKVLVSNLAADADQVFTFTIKLSDTSISKTYGEGDDAVTFENGVATVRLKGGESKTIEGLPTGITYEITETAVTGIPNTAKTGDTGAITPDGAVATFTNTRETGDLELSKKLVSDLAADKDATFTFTVTLNDETISGSFGGMTFENGVATVTLKGGEKATATGLPTTVGYTITEAKAEGFELTGKTGDTGSISTTVSKAEFINTRETGDLEVTKAVVSDNAADADEEFEFTVTLDDNTINGTYGDMTFTAGKATFKLKKGGKATATGLPTTVGYTVEEAANSDFTTTSEGEEGTISKTKSTAAFTNTRKTGGLTLSKVLVSDLAADKDQVFTFTITLSDKTISKTYSGVEFKDGEATVTLKGGESKTIEGLPTGITYEIAETAVTGIPNTAKTGDTGSITVNGATATFTNTREKGNLEVTKTVESPQLNRDKNVEFEFKVTLADNTISGKYGDMTFDKGVATFKLKHDEKATATGLPTTVGYKVEETPVPGYTTTSTGDEGSISKDKAATAAFTNKADQTQITVNKIWDDAEDQDGYRPEEVTFTLTGTAGEAEVYTDTQTVAVADTAAGTATYTWEDLTTHYNGTEISYAVTEATIDHYTADIGELKPVKEGDKVTGYTVDVTNTHTPATTNVTVEKIWDDNDNYDELRPEGITVHLTAKAGTKDATLPAGVSKDITLTKDNADAADKNKWTYTWSDLPLREDGVLITYTVDENAVNGYNKSVVGPTSRETTEGDADTVVYKVEITNKLYDVVKKAESPELKILKKDQDGLAMEGVTFTLTNPDNNKTIDGTTNADGIAEIDIPVNNDWLPDDERDEGKKKEYNFTLTETPVAGYEEIGPWNVKVTLKPLEDGKTYRYEIIDVEGEDGTKSKAWQRFIEWIISGLTGEPAAAYDWDGENVYLTVTNKAAKQSVEVTKEYAGVESLPADFAIDVTYVPYGAVKDEEGKIPTTTKTLKASDEGAVVEGKKITWTIDDVRFGSKVTAVESGYEEQGYGVESTYTTKIKGGDATEPAQGTTATIAKVPAGKEEGEIVGNIDFTNIYTHINLVINKTIDELVSYDSNVEVKDATFTFRIVGKDAKGNEVLNTVASVMFNASTGKSSSVTIEKIPATIDTITVTEIDSGNYKSAKVEEESMTEANYTKTWTVSFDNTQEGNDYESGAINKYKKSGTGYVKDGSSGTQTTEGGAGDSGQN